MALLLALMGAAAVGVSGYLWDERRPLFFGLLGLLAVAFGLLMHQARSATPSSRPSGQEVHPGIRAHAIPVAGGVGLVFVIGLLFMFWSAVPGFRPLVVAAAALGLGGGVVLILLRKWKS
jgi:hypothetical protein